MQRVLLTGGAGFIGSHLADELLGKGYGVRALDNLSPQVHGENARRPSYLDDRVDLVVGDVRDPGMVADALKGIDLVVHLAAAVGVGQSMYEIREYTSVNNLGTAVLLEQLAAHPVKRLVVASSMSIYGEGRYVAEDGSSLDTVTRASDRLKRDQWNPVLDGGGALKPIPTPEKKAPALSSVYALSKYDQERLCLMVGRAYDVPTVALRLFNTYGPRQALSNPYTGVLAIFSARLLNGKRPLVFEDGQQMRDFVSVHDVARAFRHALEVEDAAYGVFNVGSGDAVTIRSVAERLADSIGVDIPPEITGRYRVGDVRHCFADVSLAKSVLGYRPRVSLERGMAELTAWLGGQTAVDRVDQARRELDRRGLTI